MFAARAIPNVALAHVVLYLLLIFVREKEKR